MSRADIAAQNVILGLCKGFSCLELDFRDSSDGNIAFWRSMWKWASSDGKTLLNGVKRFKISFAKFSLSVSFNSCTNWTLCG